jgi:hypothetical protein
VLWPNTKLTRRSHLSRCPVKEKCVSPLSQTFSNTSPTWVDGPVYPGAGLGRGGGIAWPLDDVEVTLFWARDTISVA